MLGMAASCNKGEREGERERGRERGREREGERERGRERRRERERGWEGERISTQEGGSGKDANANALQRKWGTGRKFWQMQYPKTTHNNYFSHSYRCLSISRHTSSAQCLQDNTQHHTSLWYVTYNFMYKLHVYTCRSCKNWEPPLLHVYGWRLDSFPSSSPCVLTLDLWTHSQEKLWRRRLSPTFVRASSKVKRVLEAEHLGMRLLGYRPLPCFLQYMCKCQLTRALKSTAASSNLPIFRRVLALWRRA